MQDLMSNPNPVSEISKDMKSFPFNSHCSTIQTVGRNSLPIMMGLTTLAYFSVSTNAMSVRCMRDKSSSLESCDLQIYAAVLSGNSGNMIRLNFSNGYQVEAFCVDEQSKKCLVRNSQDKQWEQGRIDWIEKHNFSAAFWIKTSSGETLGIYDAPSTY